MYKNTKKILEKVLIKIGNSVANKIAKNESLSYKICSLLGKIQDKIKDKSCINAAKEIEEYIKSEGVIEVQRGPLAGTVFPASEISSIKQLVPQLIGSYETELNELLWRLLEEDYQQIVNVGAGWGYYCVGLARQFPETSVHAFEIDNRNRTLCKRVSRLNEVHDRLHLHGACDTEKLKEIISGDNGLLVVDCEGCEIELLRPDKVIRLQNMDVLVEVHDYRTEGPTTTEILCKRFRASHEMTFINLQNRNANNYPELENVGRIARKYLIDEGRVYSRGWIYLSTR